LSNLVAFLTAIFGEQRIERSQFGREAGSCGWTGAKFGANLGDECLQGVGG
jgi:hypothetical protein